MTLFFEEHFENIELRVVEFKKGVGPVNVVSSQSLFGPEKVEMDRWPENKITLSLEYSIQWPKKSRRKSD